MRIELGCYVADWWSPDLAQLHGFSLTETVPMPANNLSVIFERGPYPAHASDLRG